MYSLQKVIARFGFVVIIVLPGIRLEVDDLEWRSAEECATPDHETGRCVQLFSCPSLLPLFSSPPKDRLSYVKNFRCGSRYSPPQVCCPPVYRFDSKPHSVPLSDRRYCGRQHSDDYLHSDRKNKTKIDEFPWVVAVMTMLGGGKNPPREVIYCHGVLIDRRYSLTSVKCIEDTDKHLKSWVRLGDYTTNTKVDCVDVHVDTDCNKPEDVGIEAILKHPLYNEGNYVFLKINDIGLLRLNKTLDYTEYIRPICLPESGINFPRIGDVVYSAGWTLPNNVRYDPYVKRKSTVTLIDETECVKYLKTTTPAVFDRGTFRPSRVVGQYFVCGRELYELRSSIDGEPVMFAKKSQWYLAGISSWNYAQNETTPSRYTKVTHYLNWIRDSIETLNKKYGYYY